MSNPHGDGHREWNTNILDLGIQPNPSSAIYHSATLGTDSSPPVKQDGDHYLIRPHAEGLVSWPACSGCQQVSTCVSVLSFLGLFTNSKGSNYQGFNESGFL